MFICVFFQMVMSFNCHLKYVYIYILYTLIITNISFVGGEQDFFEEQSKSGSFNLEGLGSLRVALVHMCQFKNSSLR